MRNVLLSLTMLLLALPAVAQSDDPLDGYLLYGVSGASDTLIRYDFEAQSLSTVGTIRLGDGTTLDGIEAMAYVPRNLNLFGFWFDAAANESRLLYINSFNAEANIVGASLGQGHITAATIALMDVDAQGNLVLGTDGDHDKGHGNDCDGIDEENPGNSTGVSENGMGHGAHGGCWQLIDPYEPTDVGDVQKTRVFAIQTVEAEEDDSIDFDITGGEVVPTEPYAARATVLGAAITYGGTYDVPVTVQVRVGDTILEPFGDFDGPAQDSVNDDNNPRQCILPDTYEPGVGVSIKARSWTKKKSWYNGNSNNHWQAFLTIDSHAGSSNVLVLRDGDAVPAIEPFMNQDAISDFVRDYIDPETNTIILDENQAIYLFELGTTNLGSDAADFQDLVVLLTLADDPAQLLDEDDDDAQVDPAARLVHVNTQTGAMAQIMTLGRVYDGLAASPTSRFYATCGQELYRLDPIEQTETLLGTLPAADMFGAEFAGYTMCGFAIVDDQLYPIDTNGYLLDVPIDLGATDLRSIVFMRSADEPNPLAAAYD
jgi:hypothetical protein